jgi:hypothetical protein
MKTYLVDTENVHNTWVSVLDKLGPKDRVILFATENSPKMTLSEVKSMEPWLDRISVIDVFSGTPNALDFQLCAYLGHLAHNATKSEFVIVSQDNGYDPVIAMMIQRGRNVSRIDTKEGFVQKKDTVSAVKKVRNVIVKKEAANTQAQKIADLIGKDVKNADVVHISKAFDSGNTLSKLHENLQQWKGNTGIQYYREVKNYFVSMKSGIGA